MGAGQSDLYKGTYGDSIDNIPDEANPKKKEKYVFDKGPSDEQKLPELTNVQKANIERLENTIRDHLKDEDFTGTKADLEGNPIERNVGGYFDHKGEMVDSYKALKRATKSLEGSLSNPTLGEAERKTIEAALAKGLEAILKIEELFNGYGGI